MMLHQPCLTSESHSEQQQCLLGAIWITSIAIVSCLFYLQATLVTWEFVCKLLQDEHVDVNQKGQGFYSHTPIAIVHPTIPLHLYHCNKHNLIQSAIL
jgi:hypothetical protein